MSERVYRRLTRLAGFAVASMVLAVGAALVPVPGYYGTLLIWVIASVPFYLAIGPYQADLALNDGLTENERRWWRIALYLLPWSMALYWRQWVRR